jgi:predicted RNase H-like HicB family nuclease
LPQSNGIFGSYDKTGAPAGMTNTSGQHAGPKEQLMRYAVVIEEAGARYSAYVPDLPDCVATAKTAVLVEREIRSAIRAHIDELEQNGLPIPAPSSIAKYIDA